MGGLKIQMVISRSFVVHYFAQNIVVALRLSIQCALRSPWVLSLVRERAGAGVQDDSYCPWFSDKKRAASRQGSTCKKVFLLCRNYSL